MTQRYLVFKVALYKYLLHLSLALVRSATTVNMIFGTEKLFANFDFDKGELLLNSNSTEIIFSLLAREQLLEFIRGIDLALVFGMRVTDSLAGGITLKIAPQQVRFSCEEKEITLNRTEWNMLKNSLTVTAPAMYARKLQP